MGTHWYQRKVYLQHRQVRSAGRYFIPGSCLSFQMWPKRKNSRYILYNIFPGTILTEWFWRVLDQPSLQALVPILTQGACSSYNFHIQSPSHLTALLFFPSSHSGNVTVVSGHLARLNCRVRNLGNRTVSWIRLQDLSLLTVGRYTYTSDLRFDLLFSLFSHPEQVWGDPREAQPRLAAGVEEHSTDWLRCFEWELSVCDGKRRTLRVPGVDKPPHGPRGPPHGQRWLPKNSRGDPQIR